MSRTSLCDYDDAYILVNGTITITGAGNDDAAKRLDEKNKGVIFKNFSPFTDCISEINNAQIDNSKYIDVVLPMQNLIEYGDNYSKTPGSSWPYHRDDPNDIITWSEPFKYKTKISGKTLVAGNTKNVKISVPLKYLSNFWRTLEMLLINCEVNLILTWSEDCVISSTNGQIKFKITDTKLYVPVVTLSTEDNKKLLQQLQLGFKGTINWSKYQTKVSTEGVNQFLDFLIDTSFQGVNRLFVLSFENEGDRKLHTEYYLTNAQIKNYSIMIDAKNFFDQSFKHNIRTYDNIPKISTGQEYDYATGCLLDYNYFKEHYNMIAIDLGKQLELDFDPKAIKQINFTRNLEQQVKVFFIIEEVNKRVLNFSQGTIKVF